MSLKVCSTKVPPVGSDTPISVENDPYKIHFGPYPKHLTEQTRTAVDKRTWIMSKRKCGKVGEACVQVPDGMNTEETPTGSFVCHRFRVQKPPDDIAPAA
jgi:hypothetical protein